ncbi:MAG TPA: hypothetical protein P5525_07430 [Candidatus Paceibacterota bacterium]|nr:hypothetical protein [Candidatus Paceibacterota bacterium]
MRKTTWFFLRGALCASLMCGAVHAQIVVDDFEYATEDDLLAAWTPSPNAVLSLSEDVSSQSTGLKAMRVQFNFPSTAWATETINGQPLSEPIAIGDAQYVTLRVKGDPVFASADFRYFYVYAWDVYGNFGRWGAPIPMTSEWGVFNFSAGGIAQPWNSPGLPDLTQIVQFAFYQYGSQAAIDPYTATVEVDELAIRDEPLTEPVVPKEFVVEAFEYADDAALGAAWVPSPNTLVSLSTAVAQLSPGQKALRARLTFPSGEWATQVIQGPDLAAPVSIASTQYVTLRLKGDSAFAAADFRDFYLYAYDGSGNFGRWGTPAPTTADWQVVNFSAGSIAKPWDSPALPDLGNIVRFAIFQYGSEAAIPEYTATVEVDDIMVRHTPLIEVVTSEYMIDDFEYATEEDLLAAWTASANSFVATSDVVSPESAGQKSMSATFNFPSSAWVVENIRGSSFATPIVIGPKQYVTLRIKGDPAFATTDFQSFFVYAFDASGNFGRWGAPAPATDDWQILNFLAGDIAQPWDSPGLPDLGRIVRMSFFQYGSQAAIEPYTATILVDDLMVRDTPLFPAPAPLRSLLDDFEGYADTIALEAFYTYQNSPAELTSTAASLLTPAPQGNKGLELGIYFAAGQYPWGSVRSAIVEPFSFPADGVVTLRFKGDPALAGAADAGTSFWLTFYDQAGGAASFVTDGAPVVSGEWTTLEARRSDFSNASAVDFGNLVQWRLLVQAREGTAESEPVYAVFSLDDLRIGTEPAAPPTLSVGRDGSSIVLTASGLTAGKVYRLSSSANLTQWTPGAEVTATATTATWTVQPTQNVEFFRVAEKTP